MAFNDSEGLEYRNVLKIGVLELGWLQDQLAEVAQVRQLADMAEPGFIGRWSGASGRQRHRR